MEFIIELIVIFIVNLTLLFIIKKHPNLLFNSIGKIHVDPKTGLGRFELESKYVENLKNDGVDVKFIVGPGLFHIYPLFPIPEARTAFNELKKEIID